MEFEKNNGAPSKKHQIFLDLDGVLVDLDRGLLETCDFRFPEVRTARTPENRKLVEGVWNNIADWCPEFWHGIPPMNDYLDLWKYCRQFKPFVLTATPEIYGHDYRHYACGHYKRMWVQFWLGEDMVPKTIITKSALKQQVISEMKLQSPILIDDHISNIRRWNENGGIGIHHKNSSDTILELENILKA